MNIRIPAEWEPHACCWMAWAAQREEWRDWIHVVRNELAAVIEAVAEFEPVRLLTPLDQIAEACTRFSGSNVEIVEASVDDVWMRDIAPTFGVRGEEVVAIDWNFNGWGCTKERPGRPGDQLAKNSESIFGVPRISALFVAEGGAMITDGDGTLITTRSCLLNPNRNPAHVTTQLIERELAKLGILRTIWLEGDRTEPVTSGHVDGYVLFYAPGAALVEVSEDEQVKPSVYRSRDVALLEQAKDAVERTLNLQQISAPRKRYWKFRNETFASCYLNAYVTNGAVITARFGDTERDEAAKAALEAAFPNSKVVMLTINHIAAGGGGVHCLTQPMFAI